MKTFDVKLQELVGLNGLDHINLPVESLHLYFELSVHWGEKINITANLNLSDYILENLLDPVVALQGLKRDATEALPHIVTDLGCGGGYVGLTWAILEPELKVHLVDADRKKINFCKQAIREMGLSARVSAEQKRAEELRGLSGLVCSRATWGAEEFFSRLRFNAQQQVVGAYLGGAEEEITFAGIQKIPYQIKPDIKKECCILVR